MSARSDLRFEALRLAHAIREYLDRAGIVVDHGAERIASEQARALETLLSRQVLGTLAEAPVEQLLSVALDLAEEQGEYSEGLRRQVARQLGALKIATPWYDEPQFYERSVRDCATGALLLVIEEDYTDSTYDCQYYALRGCGPELQRGLARDEAERRAAEWLKREGWVQAPEPPEAP